ncbi:MAG: InlB B-repeat-containing protein [Treponema sp.]|nr:InlB B-repeat-containing protein [Treponema sp.]
MSTQLRIFLMTLVVVCALLGCAPPIDTLWNYDEDGRIGHTTVPTDTLWIELLRNMYDTDAANNRFRPSVDLRVFGTYEGMVFPIPVHEATVQICEHPDVFPLVFTTVYNPPANGNGNGNGNGGYFRFQRTGRYLVRVLYDGSESAPHSIQVGSLGGTPGIIGGPDNPDDGITIVWNPLVEFDLRGGTYTGDPALLSQRVGYGGQATIPTPPPVRPGYIFTGWYHNGHSVPFDFDTLIFEGRPLHARWDPE